MTNNSDKEAGKNSRELEREVEQQRGALEDTITALIERFSPQQILTQVFSSRGGGDVSRGLVDMVRANPLPAMLTATGLIWMLMGQSRPVSRLRSDSDADAPSHASYGVDPDYDPHSGEGHVALEKGEGVREEAHQRAEAARHRAAQYREEMERSAGHMLRDQPLAVGAIGIALGALAGALFPPSRKENETLGKYRDQIVNKASDLARDASRKADEVGRRMSDELKEQNRIPEAPKTRH